MVMRIFSFFQEAGIAFCSRGELANMVLLFLHLGIMFGFLLLLETCLSSLPQILFSHAPQQKILATGLRPS